MTDLAPQVMTSRQAVPSTAPALDGEFRMAQAIAKAGDMLPRSYRDKPGAVILVMQWAKSRDVDVLTAIQTVSFIEGRPVIDATMQRALAGRAGYRVEITEATRTTATVRVWRELDKLVMGQATYTIEDAKTAGLTGKKNWQQNPEDMLVARATTRALKRCAPEVMLGLLTPDEADEVDPVTVLVDVPETPAIAETVVIDLTETNNATTIAEPAAEVEPPAPQPPVDPPEFGMEQFKSLIRTADLTQRATIEKAQEIATAKGVDLPSSLDTILCSVILDDVRSWLEAKVTADEEPF